MHDGGAVETAWQEHHGEVSGADVQGADGDNVGEYGDGQRQGNVQVAFAFLFGLVSVVGDMLSSESLTLSLWNPLMSMTKTQRMNCRVVNNMFCRAAYNTYWWRRKSIGGI